MQKEHNEKWYRGTKPRAAMAVTAVSVLLLAFAVPAQAQGEGDDAEITVEWHEDGMGFNVTSTKGISNIIIEDCFGVAHKHEFGDEEMAVDHIEDFVISAIWVKSGNNHDPEDPEPPAPFNNPGAGMYFENTNAVCEPREPVCDGPEDVSATALSDGSILVDWTAVDNASQYNVYRAVGDGDFSLLNTTDGTTTSLTDSDTTGGETYHYRVTAMVDGNETGHCDTATATAASEQQAVCDGPEDITALAQTDGSIKVDWTAVDGASQYNVYRAEGDGGFSLLTTTDGNTTMLTDSDTTVGETYHYRATAIVEGDETQHCDTASATAIPVFPTVVAGATAALVGIGAYSVFRRRNA